MALIKNIDQLRQEVLETNERLKKDRTAIHQVREIHNGHGKVFASLNIELKYAALRKEKPSIEFLKY